MDKTLGIGLVTTLILFVGLALFASQTRAENLRIGEPAPDFSLPDAFGETHSLADYQGQWLLLYFYPKNDTPGCTTEACNFRDGYLALRQLGAQVVGVSLDDGDSHRDFAKKYELPFPLLSDLDGSTAQRYDALTNLGVVKFAKRHSFLIDPQGRLARIYRKVNPDTHNQEVLADIQTIQSERS